jgi:hypothetical protein
MQFIIIYKIHSNRNKTRFDCAYFNNEKDATEALYQLQRAVDTGANVEWRLFC